MQFVPFNSRDKRHKSVFGSIAAGSSLRLCVLMPRSFSCSGVKLVIHADGEAEQYRDMYWCGMNGDCEEWWDITFAPEKAGLYFYRFVYSTPFGSGNIFLRSGGCGEFAPDGSEWQLTVYDSRYKTPDWVKGGIMYQIFPDRFNIGKADMQNIPSDRVLHKSTDELPVWQPDKNGKIKNNDYYGGNLDGITKKLDYIQSLGVNMVYLNPIFEAHENHRYNTADYSRIDPLLGTEKDFKALCREAKKRGIGIILDGVFSHTGADSIYFNKYRRYGSGGAFNDENSPYRQWYTFNKDGTYESWWGIDTLPETDENNESYTEFIAGKDGIIKKWLKAGASGFRLDVADELPDEFLDNVRNCIKNCSPDAFLIGEVWEDATNKISHGGRRRYLLGDQLDSVMNYPFACAILAFVRYGVAERFMEAVVTVCENYPKPALDCLMNHIGTHDTARILSRIADYEIEDKPRRALAKHKIAADELPRACALLKTAATLQYTLPGFPSLYYGDEAGMTGGGDPFNRGFFPWGKENADLTAHYKKLGEIRRSLTCLADGNFRPYSAMLSCVAYIRENENEKIFVIANRNEHFIDYNLPEEFFGGFEMLTGSRISTSVRVPAYGSAVIHKKI